MLILKGKVDQLCPAQQSASSKTENSNSDLTYTQIWKKKKDFILDDISEPLAVHVHKYGSTGLDSLPFKVFQPRQEISFKN